MTLNVPVIKIQYVINVFCLLSCSKASKEKQINGSLSTFTLTHPLFLFIEHCCVQQHRTWQLKAPKWLQLPCGQVKFFSLLFSSFFLCNSSSFTSVGLSQQAWGNRQAPLCFYCSEAEWTLAGFCVTDSQMLWRPCFPCWWDVEERAALFLAWEPTMGDRVCVCVCWEVVIWAPSSVRRL